MMDNFFVVDFARGGEGVIEGVATPHAASTDETRFMKPKEKK